MSGSRRSKPSRTPSSRLPGYVFGAAQGCDDGEVFEGGGISGDGAGGGELAEEAAHDFAGAGFGELLGEAEVVGAGERADLLGDPLAEFLLQFFGGLGAFFERDKGGDGLAFEVVGTADDGGFSDPGMSY